MYPHHVPDLVAFLAVLVGVVILALVGHASAELLTAAAAAGSVVYSLCARRPVPARAQP